MYPIKNFVAALGFVAALAGAAPAQSPGYDAASSARPSDGVADLARDLRAVRDELGAARGAILVVSLDRGDTLFAWNADAPLAPASNLKLFSTAAALHYLGADFRWSTYLLATGETAGGVLNGDLVLFGTGDPTLGSGRFPGTAGALRAMADSLRRIGVREIAGSVVADGSFFDPRLRGEGWTGDDLVRWYGAPTAALVTGENLVSPGGRPVSDPVRSAGERFHSALASAGIRVRGGVRTVRDPASSAASFHAPRGASIPAGRVLAVHRSPTLGEVARVTNHVSHNLFADELLRTVGRAAQGEGSFDGGERAVARMLGVNEALRMLDGSGLSRLDRTSARAVVELLARMDRSPESSAFRASLPVAGSERGLRRMYGTAAAGNLRAKTGTLSGVSALGGYVTAANGERLAFSIITNGAPSTGAAKDAENRIGARLARFAR
ncbi:MAG TPA: D-alanyl-D-alanine carboxypeptidase/D-alanyl-D-alanine-endopeptidase [Longimicrobium sp.]|jgi:D-alanyl-D-alanine carboxypeptidase/D-alanyl-D-alanine-endopeptidase (penicillin-binding protein 4)